MFTCVFLSICLGAAGPPEAAESSGGPERFILLSEFEVWADAAGPEVFRKLNELYLVHGRSHVFSLYPHYDYFVWEFPRMRHWVDEAVALGAFNVFCIGDDTRMAKGHIFGPDGINPELADVFFRTVSYAHGRGLMVAVEPVGLPKRRDVEHFKPWLKSWLGPQVAPEARANIIKLSIEWFDAYRYNPEIDREVAAFLTACREVNPRVLVYIDSIGGPWRRPQPFHRRLLDRFPGTIISHYLNTNQVDAFRAIGARNLMVQINPCETADRGGQFFIYHEKTVEFLEDVVAKHVRYVSLAGVNFGYSRYNYDLFLEVIRPHLKLARTVKDLRAGIVPDRIVNPATEEEVRSWLLEKRREAAENDREPPIPRNAAGRPACLGTASPGCRVRRLGAILDGKIGPRFAGAYTDPYLRKPVEAVFSLDFGAVRKIHEIRVVPCLHPAETTYIATDFHLEYRRNGKWQTIPGGAVEGNRQPEVKFDFPPCEADAVRIAIQSETDDRKGNYRACCQELAVK